MTVTTTKKNWKERKMKLPSSKYYLYNQKRSAATAAAKSLQSCPTLCNLIDGSPPDSPIPGILQVRVLEWVAIDVAIVKMCMFIPVLWGFKEEFKEAILGRQKRIKGN